MKKLLLLFLFNSVVPVSASTPEIGGVDYFPLAVGNQWRYDCSVEGNKVFEKELKILKKVKVAGKPGYEASYIVNGSLAKLYFWEDTNRVVHRSYTIAGELDEMVVSRAAKIGDDLGELHIRREVMQSSIATGNVNTLVVENFDPESPQLSAQTRHEWRGLFYANKIGLVVEADGLGGDCVLKRYSLVESK
ncbi:MAG: hypothetical protein PHH11_08185 [Methylomonas sp.]|nr:hypothetical protein [Methylomonas sp.]